MCACILSSFSHVQLFVTPWTVARQASLSMGFSRQEYWSGLPRPPLGDLPDWEIQSTPPVSPPLAIRFFITNATWENLMVKHYVKCMLRERGKEREVAQSCPTLCDPMDSSVHQAPPSMGFSRQGYWSGLPGMLSTELINGSHLIGFPCREAQLIKNLPSIQETLV